jgi:hypothetical protein
MFNYFFSSLLGLTFLQLFLLIIFPPLRSVRGKVARKAACRCNVTRIAQFRCKTKMGGRHIYMCQTVLRSHFDNSVFLQRRDEPSSTEVAAAGPPVTVPPSLRRSCKYRGPSLRRSCKYCSTEII